MARNRLTDEQVEEEIERLRKSPDVALARTEKRLKYKRRQQLWSLRSLEKRGKELRGLGITTENIEEMISDAETDILKE